jgi:hypothetical protein
MTESAVELCGEAMGRSQDNPQHECFCVRPKGHPYIHGDYRMHVCICGRTTDEWKDEA